MVEFIAEIGNNHNGSLERALRLIDAAKRSGATVVKLQIRDFDSLYRNTNNSVEDLGVEYTKDLLKKYELTLEDHTIIFEYCRGIGIDYMCTPWDVQSVDFLENLGVQRYKIASADFDNLPLLNKLVATQKPLILSTGMSNTDEIESRIQWLHERCTDFTILHCNSTYPAPFEDIELPYISRLRQLTANVGYSGHERGIAISIAAVALGATVIERHFTEDKELEGPDHQASLLPSEFKQMVDFANQVCLGMAIKQKDHKTLSQGALLNKEILGKSIIAARDLSIGTVLTQSDLEVRSPGQGLPPSELQRVIGKKLAQPLGKHEFVTYSHFNKKMKRDTPALSDFQWGIPVRPHDVFDMHSVFDAKVYEFHISYSDLSRSLPTGDWEALRNRKILVHAPELFENSMLLDLTATEGINQQIENLNRVCRFSRELREKIGYQDAIGIIANIGGFSTHAFRSKGEKHLLYERVINNLSKVDESHCNIFIQNMAPFPWHFGGQRYQNIFAKPEEIIEFCVETGRKITLDTAHLSMFCSHAERSFEVDFEALIPYAAHLHISDAKGNNGEGVKLGTGDINFKSVIANIRDFQTFIVETWQGHKEFGAGFTADLSYLADIAG